MIFGPNKCEIKSSFGGKKTCKLSKYNAQELGERKMSYVLKSAQMINMAKAQ